MAVDKSIKQASTNPRNIFLNCSFPKDHNEDREVVDILRGLVVRCFDGGSLGFFLSNALGDEDTEVRI